jgi:glucoamylase
VNGGPAPQPENRVGQSWTSGAKDLVMTTLGPSKVWATLARGIVTEVYWPSVDQPQVKDFGFLVAGKDWWREVKRVGLYDLSVGDPVVPTATIVHRGASGGPKYRLTLRPVVDPDHDALLISYELEGDDVRLYPLLAPHLGVCQVTDQQWSQLGADNVAWVDLGGDALYASGSGRYLCLLAAPGFARASAGYVGDSDGWTDFQAHGAMQWQYSQAGPGVIALTGELANATGLLAVGFGGSDVEARAAAQASLDAGYDTVVTRYAASWRDWVGALKLPAPPQPAGLADALRQSAVVLRSHADRGIPGAYVAGLAIPWGDVTNDPGGYHRVWCRDGGETALALAAAGHTDDALDALSFLVSRQSADGSWPRCFFISPPNTYDPNEAVQLDEVAFPLVLAGKLFELGVALPGTVRAAVGKAARYLAANGPASQMDVDRWEENPGASPFTLGLEVVAMLIAAQLLTDDTDRQLALALADNWNERIEELCYVSGDEIDQYFDTNGHYVRIGSISTVSVHNQPPGTQPLDATTLIGMEFLYLPRLGLRAPDDLRILDTLKIAEVMLGSDTPSGRAYHRYDTDGYGEWLDGSGFPIRNYGIGRPWPLLAGERGHFEVASNTPPTAQLEAMLAMRGRGGLLPEQIWDADSLPWRQLAPGHPTGSAMPLAWAHSELIKLAVAAQNARPFEQLKLITDRYNSTPPVSKAWYWSDNTPVTALPTDRTLVIVDTRPFTLHYGFNNWDPSTVHEAEATSIGLGLSGVTLTAEEFGTHDSLQFVRRYQDGWENSSRHDVALNSDHLNGVQLSPAHLARLRASGAKN